ncbi:hypothetical protein PHLCEN_2v3937 [Hermanssonia centrifuga]|uniref:Uncharacterized protein n=1 Tax=Hermanssonia centrifuga TaxID=98765 RepID=A0A2R6QB53_9APHY|nr:hypothetical protein PHLCEN_2v3937 [Hermanssonia centrifuga]
MSANPEDLSYIHRRCVLVDELVSLEWAHPPYDAEGRYDLPLISVRMHRLRDLAEAVYTDLEAHPEVPRTPAPCLPFDLVTRIEGEMKCGRRVRRRESARTEVLSSRT